MIILGLDPGSRITGFGLIHKKGNRSEHIENGALYVQSITDYAKRLAHISTEVQRLILTYQVDQVAIENIFYHKSVRAVQKLGEVRGVMMASAALCGKPVFEYTPLQVKSAVTGYGKAQKSQVQVMVRTLLNLKDLAEENASDALGIALCHAHQNSKIQMVSSSEKPQALNTNQDLLKKASFYR